MLRDKILKILSDIKHLQENQSDDNRLPQNTFYLNDKEILCYPREYGVSRFPYDCDGLVLWAHTSGYIDACESLFNIFKTANYNEDAVVNFFAGVKRDDGYYFPISILGADRQLFEPSDVKRYVVFSLRCAYYITDTDEFTFAVRMHIDKEKEIHFSVTGINKTDKESEFYLASYFEAMLRYIQSEDFFNRMTRFGRHYENGSFILKCLNAGFDCMTINLKIDAKQITNRYYTTSRSVFLGFKGRNLANAESLKVGKFDREVDNVNTTALPIASDMVHFKVGGGDSVSMVYSLIISHDEATADKLRSKVIDTEKIDEELISWEESESAEYDNLQIKFEKWHNEKVSAPVLNRFLRNVQKQVSFCALGKNYAGAHLGIRDVYQQLEASLIWQPEKSRKQILVTLNYILSNGRAPRQISFPPDENTLPNLDLRPYIDQGVWIISTIYTYLCYTDDYSLLEEKCSYYDCENTYGPLSKSDCVDTVLMHMLKITDFLSSNIDTEYQTGCLRALYGDWNDALDGLGRTKDKDKEFGSGVSVMATLQFYQNLYEMSEILRHVKGYEDKIKKYQAIRSNIEKGLFKYACDTNEKGEKRIIHGWGDKLAYKVGSFKDCDGVSRISLTANSFWAITGMLNNDTSLKENILKDLDALDSRYGLKTFSEPFPLSAIPYVGRIATITPGTYENSAAYVHAGMFGIMALFSMGEPQRAWTQMEKSMVITHDNATMTTFVMPNSYCESEEYNIDGESMGDWYTGSGTVLIKEIIKYGFGIMPTLDGLVIQTPKYMPSQKAEITLKVKGCNVTLNYSNNKNENRKMFVNGKVVSGIYDPVMDINKLYIDSSLLRGNLTIDIRD